MTSGSSRGSLIDRGPLPVSFNHLTIALILSVGVLASCVSKDVAKPEVYNGPLQVAENIVVNHTENDHVKTILKAKKLFEYQNGDQEFPEGLYLEFYDTHGKLTSTLKCNSAFHFKEERKWRGRGDVEIKNIEKAQQLNTEELFWKPDTRKIFTDKFVTITDGGEILYGTGLDAVQDMSVYSIKKPSGIFDVKD